MGVTGHDLAYQRGRVAKLVGMGFPVSDLVIGLGDDNFRISGRLLELLLTEAESLHRAAPPAPRLSTERDEMRKLITARIAILLSPQYMNVGVEVQALVTAYVALELEK